MHEIAESRGAVVVTGASSGIGAGFARRLAQRGHDLVLVARRRDRLDELAEDLIGRHGISVTVLAADLSVPGAAEALVAELDATGVSVSGLINSAGFGTAAPLADESAVRVRDEIQVNVAALTLLTRALLPRLLAARGMLVNVSSTASHQPIPGMGVYAASKAYATSLTESVWHETRGTGLTVLALCPGPTATEFFDAAGSDAFAVGAVATVDEVLDAAFRALDRGPVAGPVLTVGRTNRVRGWLGRVAPRRLRLRIAADLAATGGRR